MSPFYDDYTPRPTAQVYQLRKAGRIDEAYHVASGLYRRDSSSDDVKKAYAWTLIDLCKRDLASENTQSASQWLSSLSQICFDSYDDFTETILKQVKTLRMKLDPSYSLIQNAYELSRNGQNDEAYRILYGIASEGNLSTDYHENYGWVIYRYLRDNVQTLDSIQVRKRLRDYILLENERPSNLHSQVLNFALNYSRIASDFKLTSFLQLWGPQNLRDADFADSIAADGKRIPSLMSRIAREIVKYPFEEVSQFINLLSEGRSQFIEMLRESYFWQLYNLSNERKYQDLWSHFDSYPSSYAQFGPSSAHSKILGLAERTMKDENQYRFYEFFRNWGPSNLRKEDWLEETAANGDKYKPLAMKAIKKASDATDGMSAVSNESLDWLIEAHDVAIEKFPEDDWTIRSKAILLLKSGRKANADELYRELALKIGDRYYIWHEFSDCVDEAELKIGMLCKAISLERNEDFIGKIRLDLAEMLLGVNPKAAALEIKLHKDHYEAKGWAVKPRVHALLDACGNPLECADDNTEVYQRYIPLAEEYAYSEIPYTDWVMVDEWKNNEGKKLQKYVDENGTELVLNPYKYRQLKKSSAGQVWSIKVYCSAKSVPLLIKRSDRPKWSVLPVVYGYVGHINEEKKLYHIYSQNSEMISCRYVDKEFAKGDYVSFRAYTSKSGDTSRTNAYSLRRCAKDVALAKFRSVVAAVSGVNESSKVIHYSLGPGHLSGIIRYDQTDIRPNVGDSLRISYYVREKKDADRPLAKKKIIEVLKVESTTEINTNAVREFTGTLEVKYYDRDRYWDCDPDSESLPDFAFVGDYFVHKSLLEAKRITGDCRVKGKAVYAGDKKWKTFSLDVI